MHLNDIKDALRRHCRATLAEAALYPLSSRYLESLRLNMSLAQSWWIRKPGEVGEIYEGQRQIIPLNCRLLSPTKNTIAIRQHA